MRKFTLLLAALVFSGMTFAQETVKTSINAAPLKIDGKAKIMKESKSTVYWSEDFDGTKWSATVVDDGNNGYKYDGAALPEGWSVYDGNDLGYFWHWSNVGPRGRWTGADDAWDPRDDIVDVMPGTSENGFFVLESDYYHTTEVGEMSSDLKAMDAWVQYGPVDLSNADGVIMEFNQMFRYCCFSTNTLSLFVSQDYDPSNPEAAHWTEYDTKGGTLSNDYTTPSARSVAVNISATAANESSVYFRWHHTGDQATHYFWMIDDVKLVSPPQDDVIVRDSWFEYLEEGSESGDNWDRSYTFVGGYTAIPEAVLGDFVRFRSAVENFGLNTHDVKMEVNVFDESGSSIYKEESASKTLNMTDIDTLVIDTDFTPPGKGFYQVSGVTIIDGNDQNPGDNGFGYDFTVTENRYSRVYEDNADGFSSGGPTDFAAGGFDGDAVANRFEIPEDAGYTKVAGIRVYIDDYSGRDDELAAIEDGKYSIVAKVWAPDPETSYFGLIPSIIESETYYMTIDDTASWVYIPFADEGNLILQPGHYFAGVECYNGNAGEDVQRLSWQFGKDMNGPKQMYNGGITYLANPENLSWTIAEDNFAIDLYINEMPSLVNLTFNVDMTNAEGFTAGTDNVYVTGSFAGEGDGWNTPGEGESIMLTDEDGDMIYTGVAQVDGNQTVEYKYFINAGWDGGEWDGGDNRSIVIEEDDVTVNDIFGTTTINDAQLEKVALYPNPFTNTLTIDNLENVSEVIVSNVLGQRVMTLDQVDRKMVVSTSDLETGVYFITIVDNNNNTRTERMVKQ